MDEDEELLLEAPDATNEEIDLQSRMSKRAFVLYHKKLAAMPNWISVTDIFKISGDAELLKRAGVNSFDDPKFSKYSSRLQKVRGIRDYVYRLDILEETMSYEEATEIFVRVNSQGAKLRGSDLALAQVTARWRGALAMFKEYAQVCIKKGFDFDTGFLVKTLVAFATSQSLFKTVSSISVPVLEESWNRANKALDFAMNFIQSNAGITHHSLLSSPFLVITLAYWADKRSYSISDEESRQMRKWLLIANAKGRYSRGSSEGLLNQDLAILRDGGNYVELFERIKQQVGNLLFDENELIGRTSRSGIFKTMFLAFKSDGAKDWWNSLEISPTHTGKPNSIQFHHIFPKKFLINNYPDISKSDVDDIANLAFISADTNAKISDNEPSQYLRDIAGTNLAALQAQSVPVDEALWQKDMFPNFLTARRRCIVETLNKFVT